MRVIAHGEADAAIADVKREVSHPLWRARCGRQRLDHDRDPRVEDRKARPPVGPQRDAPKRESELLRDLAGRVVVAPGERCGHLLRFRLGDLLALRADAPMHAIVLD